MIEQNELILCVSRLNIIIALAVNRIEHGKVESKHNLTNVFSQGLATFLSFSLFFSIFTYFPVFLVFICVDAGQSGQKCCDSSLGIQSRMFMCFVTSYLRKVTFFLFVRCRKCQHANKSAVPCSHAFFGTTFHALIYCQLKCVYCSFIISLCSAPRMIDIIVVFVVVVVDGRLL